MMTAGRAGCVVKGSLPHQAPWRGRLGHFGWSSRRDGGVFLMAQGAGPQEAVEVRREPRTGESRGAVTVTRHPRCGA